ncbi:MAG: MFS family permease [Polaromonas sp.]|jgi:MFS family permease
MKTSVNPWVIAVAGMVSLGVAMGIGRFAFTPLLPMMLNDGVIDLPAASWLASANYVGYLVGALLCLLQPWLWARFPRLPSLAFTQLIRGGLLATAVLTLAMVWSSASVWPLLRFLAGVTSGVVFIFTSGWCLSQLSRLGVPAMGGFIYMGPGAGIVLSGLFASGMVAWHWTAATGWLIFGLLAFVLTALVWPRLKGHDERLLPLVTQLKKEADPAPAAASVGHGSLEMVLLTLAYGIAGFGYIITATFLPVIARAALPGSPWLDLFWPIFGVGVMTGAWLATRIRPGGDYRCLLLGGYLMQALSIGITLWSPSLLGFALGSLLLGLPFTANTFFALQEVRRLRPAAAAIFMGLMTTTYSVGQVMGPPLVAILMHGARTPSDTFTLSLQIAMASLLFGAAIFFWMSRVYPVKAEVAATLTPAR